MSLLLKVMEQTDSFIRAGFCRALLAAGFRELLWRLISPDDEVLTGFAFNAWNVVTTALGLGEWFPKGHWVPLITVLGQYIASGVDHVPKAASRLGWLSLQRGHEVCILVNCMIEGGAPILVR